MWRLGWWGSNPGCKIMLQSSSNRSSQIFPYGRCQFYYFLAVATLIWAGMELTRNTASAVRWSVKLTHRPVDAIRELLAPDDSVTKSDIAALKAQLDRMEFAQGAAGSRPPSPDESARREQAVTDIVTDPTPAAQAAVRELTAGDLPTAIATLKRDARADVSAAADKWRRLGDLVRFINTAEARAAYEEAFRLQPDDFWTCIELSRLHQEAGDLAGACAAAEAAERAATDDRDSTVAADALGDVLREAGDLAAAAARFEAGLAISERLARDNPGSAQAQRDLSISYERLGDVLERRGQVAAAIARYEQSLPIAMALAERNPSRPGLAKDARITKRRLAELRAKLSG